MVSEESVKILELLNLIDETNPKNIWTSSQLARHFKNMLDVLQASKEDLKACVPELEDNTIKKLQRFYCLYLTLSRSEVSTLYTLKDSQAVKRYLSLTNFQSHKEYLRGLFLNKSFKLLRDEFIKEGSPSVLYIQPKDLIKRCLELESTYVVLIHNHPLGNPNPSQNDIRTTLYLGEKLKEFEITLIDHLILTSQGEPTFISRFLERKQVYEIAS